VFVIICSGITRAVGETVNWFVVSFLSQVQQTTKNLTIYL